MGGLYFCAISLCTKPSLLLIAQSTKTSFTFTTLNTSLNLSRSPPPLLCGQFPAVLKLTHECFVPALTYLQFPSLTMEVWGQSFLLLGSLAFLGMLLHLVMTGQLLPMGCFFFYSQFCCDLGSCSLFQIMARVTVWYVCICFWFSNLAMILFWLVFAGKLEFWRWV